MNEISVIIPNYNRKEALVKAVRSALGQTYAPFEIIVIDDGSGFDVKKYLQEEFSEEYLEGFLKVFVNKKNCGAAISRNIGAKKSGGNMIAFLDSDDYWECTKLEKQIDKFNHCQELDLVYCDQYLIVNGEKKESNKKMVKANLLNELIDGWTAPNTSTLMYRKESFFKLNGFDESLKSCQDHDLWFRSAINSQKIDFVDEPLSFFVLDSSGRISHNIDSRMVGVYVFLENCKRYIPDSKYNDFKLEYICDTSWPIFVKAIREGRVVMVLAVYYRYMMFNRFFYRKILNKTRGVVQSLMGG